MRRSQILAFFAGFETFHALTHAYFGLSGKGFPSRVAGLRVTPTLHAASAVLHAGIALALGTRATGEASNRGSERRRASIGMPPVGRQRSWSELIASRP
jgi:hypothetical protein